jgi:hypothetical protein
MTLQIIQCGCGMGRVLPRDLKLFERFSLGACLKCGAAFRGIRLPLLGVWRLS